MAPKPPAAKGPAAGKPGAAKTPPKPPNKLELFISGYNCATVGIFMLVSLSLYTFWYISLCAVEKAKREPLRNAVTQLRQYLIAQNAEYGSLNDIAVILEAEKASRQLLPWAEKIKKLQAEIADLHYKLNHKWVAYKGHIYLFNSNSYTFHDTVRICKSYKAHVADVQTDEEERFIETALEHKHGSYFIGLNYRDREWRWHHTNGKALKTYWAKGEPGHSNTCARVFNGCETSLQCWFSIECSTAGRGICKQKPEDKWIN